MSLLPSDSANGLKVLKEGEDSSNTAEVHPEHLYVRFRYGSLYENSATGITFTTPSTATAISNDQKDAGGTIAAGAVDSGVTAAVASGTLTVDEPGVYECEISGLVVGTGNTDAHTFALAVNGTAETGEGTFTFPDTIGDLAEPASFRVTKMITLEKGDAVSGLITNDTTSSVLYNYRLSVKQFKSTNYAKPA